MILLRPFKNPLAFLIIILCIFNLPTNVKTQTECLQSCKQCNDVLTCQKCHDGYFLNPSKSCTTCPKNCTACQWDSSISHVKCTQCDENFEVMGNQCKICSPACGLLGCEDTPDNCKDCSLNFEMKNGKCVPKGEGSYENGCVDESDGLCRQCQLKHFLYFYRCYKCPYPSFFCILDIIAVYEKYSNEIKFVFETYNEKAESQNQVVMPQDPVEDVLIMYFYVKKLRRQGILDEHIFNHMVNNPQIMKNPPKMVEECQKMYQSLTPTNNQITSWPSENVLDIAFEQKSIFQCMIGYGVYDGQCQKCPQPNCQSCDQLNGCTYCMSEYYLQPLTRKCVLCHSAIENCYECQFNENYQLTCLLCQHYYGVYENTCTICNEPCEICNQDNTCITCLTPYSRNPNSKGQCFRCTQNACLVCLETDPDICLQCMDFLYLEKGICKECPRGCYRCWENYCVQCLFGFDFDPNNQGKCIEGSRCNKGCQNCTEHDKSLCYACQYGFKLDNHFRCILCEQQNCLYYIEGACFVHEFGMTQYKGKMVPCHPGCKICDMNNPEICLECNPEHWLNGNVCSQCEQYCLICQNDKTCDMCYRYAENMNDGSCSYCTINCQKCENKVCKKCLLGYRLTDDGVCVQSCPDGCIECDRNNPNICHFCGLQHGLHSNGTCIPCYSNCFGICDASNTSICLYNPVGYDLASNSPIQCPENCQVCQNGRCIQCANGYEFIEQNLDEHEDCGWFTDLPEKYVQCKKICPPQCEKCNKQRCITCITGFKLVTGGDCVIDEESILDAQGYCQLGTYSKLGKCEKCQENCLTCSETRCEACYHGYYIDLDDRICKTCPSNCYSCISEQHCTLCTPGHYLHFLSSYYYQNIYVGYCHKCNDQCQTCFFAPQFCVTCKPGYKKQGIDCVNVKVLKFTYIFNVDFQVFIAENGIQKVTKVIADKLKIFRGDIIIKEIIQGSTKVIGEIPKQTDAEILNDKQKLSQLQFQYPVLKSQFQAFDGSGTIDECESCNCNDETSNCAQQCCPKNQCTEENCSGECRDGQCIESKAYIVGIIVGSIGGVILIIVIVCLVKRFRKTDEQYNDQLAGTKSGTIVSSDGMSTKGQDIMF